MNELLKELEDDIKHERIDKLWHSFGKLMIVVSLMVIVVTIAVVIINDRKQAAAMNQTSQFIKGLDRFNVEDYKGAIAVFSELTSDPHSPYFGMAMLRKAQAQILSGDKDGSLKTYQTLAAEGNGEPNKAFAELAKMLAAQTPENILEPKKDSPFYYTQSEWKAWQLMQKGDQKNATAVFVALRDDEHTPASMRDRATLILQHMGVDK